MVQDEEIKALLEAFVSGWGSSQHVGSTRNTLGYQERPFNLGRKIFLGARDSLKKIFSNTSLESQIIGVLSPQLTYYLLK